MNTKTARKYTRITESMKQNVYKQQAEDLKAIHKDSLWFAIRCYLVILGLLLIICFSIWAIST